MNDIADPPDSTIGSRRVLHADPKKWRWVAGIGAGFVAIGIAMIIREGDFLALLDRISPERLPSQSHSLQAAAFYIQGLQAFFAAKYNDSK